MAIIRTQRVLDVVTLVWDDTAMSGTAERVTDALDLIDTTEQARQRPINQVAYLINWANGATVVGTFAIQGTNTPLDGGSWVTIASLAINDEAGPRSLEATTALGFARLIYTNASGTGTLGVTTVCGKRTAGPGTGGGGADPTAAQVNLNWRNGNDGEYYAHADTAVAAYGDMIMFDPRKNAPGGNAEDSVLNVTLPAITSADYGKRIQTSCQYDSDTSQVDTGAYYSSGLAGSVKFSADGLDVIADTDDAVAYYGTPYTDWLAGALVGSGTSANDNAQGPYVVTLTALPPDDDAYYVTGRWTAAIETLNMGKKPAPVSRWNEVVDPATPYNASVGDRIIYTGSAGARVVNLPTAGLVQGNEVSIYIVGTGGTISVDVEPGSSSINGKGIGTNDTIDQTAPADGLGPIGGKIYSFTDTGVGWLIAGYERPA